MSGAPSRIATLALLSGFAASPAWAAPEAETALLTPRLSAGLSLGAWASQTAARHAIRPAYGAWFSYSPGLSAPRPWGLSAELNLATSSASASLYDYASRLGRGAVVAEWVVGTRPTRLRLGAGPALTGRRVQAELGAAPFTALIVEPGVRARVALDGPLGPLRWQWCMGSTSRSLATWDYDVSLGLGGRW